MALLAQPTTLKLGYETIYSFHRNSLVKKISLLISSFYPWRKLGTERWANLPKGTELEGDRAKIPNPGSWVKTTQLTPIPRTEKTIILSSWGEHVVLSILHWRIWEAKPHPCPNSPEKCKVPLLPPFVPRQVRLRMSVSRPPSPWSNGRDGSQSESQEENQEGRKMETGCSGTIQSKSEHPGRQPTKERKEMFALLTHVFSICCIIYKHVNKRKLLVSPNLHYGTGRQQVFKSEK